MLLEEIRRAGLYDELWQSFAILPAIRSVGVQGDSRTYAYPIVIRAVTSEDAMTADWARLPYDVLERISSRIINEVPGVNRVALDISSKPPARSSGSGPDGGELAGGPWRRWGKPAPRARLGGRDDRRLYQFGQHRGPASVVYTSVLVGEDDRGSRKHERSLFAAAADGCRGESWGWELSAVLRRLRRAAMRVPAARGDRRRRRRCRCATGRRRPRALPPVPTIRLAIGLQPPHGRPSSGS